VLFVLSSAVSVSSAEEVHHLTASLARCANSATEVPTDVASELKGDLAVQAIDLCPAGVRRTSDYIFSIGTGDDNLCEFHQRVFTVAADFQCTP
jgi:hypothetical protein